MQNENDQNHIYNFNPKKICNFCGQLIFDDNCDCDEAHRQRKIQHQIDRAKITIREIFSFDAENEEEKRKLVEEENLHIMYYSAEQIANHKLYSVALVLPGGIKAKLSRGAKGAIKVERIETEKEVQEIEE